VSHPNMNRADYGRCVSFLLLRDKVKQIHMPEHTQHALYDCTNKGRILFLL